MKVGILNAFTQEQEENTGFKAFREFKALFGTADHDMEFDEYRITEDHFPGLGDRDAFLITGSPSGAYEDTPWILRLQEFIRAAHAHGAPLVGICFGHQVLAHALGGRAEQSSKGWGFGRDVLYISVQQPWMRPRKETCELHYYHQDQVVELPKNAQRIAGSDFCPNGMFVIDRKVLGIQAHPEMTGDVIRNGIKKFRSGEVFTDPNVVNRAEERLVEGLADGTVVAQWIVNFLLP